VLPGVRARGLPVLEIAEDDDLGIRTGAAISWVDVLMLLLVESMVLRWELWWGMLSCRNQGGQRSSLSQITRSSGW
jgi:hypothetical protein